MTAEQLKASVLQMAIQGRLVPQLDDEPAVEIAADMPEDVPFAIPEKWQWVQLSSISEKVQYGYTASAQPQGSVKFLRITDITPTGVNWNSVPFCAIDDNKINNFKLVTDDILIARTGSVGKSYRIGCSSWLSVFASYLIRIRVKQNIILPEYAEIYLGTPWYWEQISASSRGAVQLNVNANSLSLLAIPLPPLAEQRRIVARLEELLPLIDAYGKAYTSLTRMEQALPQQLRASLLQEAIQGRLVPQLDDEPAVEIAADTPEDVPFAIPEKWQWVELKNLVIPCSQKIPDDKFFYIDVSSIDNKNHKLGKPSFLQPEEAPSRARKIVTKGMVLYSTVRPYLLNTCIIEEEFSAELICSTAFVSVACKAELLNKYLLMVLLSPYFCTYVKDVQKGVAYPAITDKLFYSAMFPLPPLAEQRRIVARLEELLPHVEAIAGITESMQ